jgi:hypothetical protein
MVSSVNGSQTDHGLRSQHCTGAFMRDYLRRLNLALQRFPDQTVRVSSGLDRALPITRFEGAGVGLFLTTAVH